VTRRGNPDLGLAKFFDLSLDGLCVADVQGRLLHVNAAFARMFDHTPDELAGRSWLDFVHEEDRAAALDAAEKLGRGEAVSLENRCRRRDGAWLRVRWELAPPYAGGFVHAVARDITEEWRRREARRSAQRRVLRYQEAQLRLRDEPRESFDDFIRFLTEQCADAIGTERVSVWLFNADGSVLECRDLYLRRTRAHERELMFRREDFPRYFRSIESFNALSVRDARTDVTTSEFEQAYLRPNGIVSMLDVAIRSGNRLAGILCCEHVGEMRQWDALEEKFATTVASYVMTAIEREERRRSEAEVRELAATLEQRVEERTAELAANERRFRALFSSQFNFIGMLSTDGVLLEANDTALAVGNLAPSDVIGRPLWETHWWDVGEDEQRKVREAVARAARGEFVRYEFEARAAGDARITVDFTITPIFDEDGRVSLLIPEGHDITHSRVVEMALRVSEEQFRTAMEHSPIGMALVAPDGKWLKVNRALCDTVGYSEEELLKIDFQSITHPEDLAADIEKVGVVLSGELATYQMEKRYIHKSGSVVWASLHVSLVRDTAGAPRYFISQVQDITERKKADEMLRQSFEHQRELARQAQAGERARREFLAMMSHEVRTPMNGIIGYGELLAHLPGLPEEGRDYADTIVRSGSALLRILDDILDWSRLDAGALEIMPVPFSPVELLSEIRTLLMPAAIAKRLDMLLEHDPAAENVFAGDAGRLRQIVLNLGGNAIKFTDRGSVTIGARVSGRDVEFYVRDTGSGIEREMIERLFDPFVQADSSHSRRHGGAGLGLAISRSLASLMGGTLTASSRPGAGSEFVARIPLQPAQPRSTAQAAPPPPVLDTNFAARHPLSILVAEDDHVNLRLIVTMLRKLGYDPIAARDGREAADCFQREHPQCVLMDVQMPHVDGIEATREIRKMEIACGRAPAFISALTADTLVSDRTRCLEAGMDDYLNKPLRRDHLVAMLKCASARHAEAGLSVA